MGGVTARIRVRGGTDDYRFVHLHNRSLDRVRERTCGGRTHVHHHVTLGSWDLVMGGDE